ncbi:coiled-coil domain-containing protein 181 isoform X2 [Brienomyrus brachyistius]|nr:coiled-coil domain-containing protein 181 isoform X2 [Brienomyrus brachyistius]XP_048835166.1 coiled-coil domain-containing protein 181 isoform X2 [Brienomyrus brachyistius]
MSEELQRGVKAAESQDNYEDDFEKDLDWLIEEEARSEDQEQGYEDIEAEIDKELEEEEKREWSQKEEEQSSEGGESERDQRVEREGERERWPSPMEPLGDVPHGDCSHGDSLPLSADMEEEEEKLDDEKKYVLEKIQQANRQLQKQSSPNQDRQRRLQFKDTLVDLVVPPLEYERDTEEQDVSERMSELHISSMQAGPTGAKEGRVLVEKDGKFDLVSLREVESQGLLPLLSSPPGNEPNSPRRSQHFLGHSRGSAPYTTIGSGPHHAPKPPSRSRNRPSSAGNTQQTIAVKRRVQSANSNGSCSTSTLSLQQKDLQVKLQRKRERLHREEQQRKQVEEEQRQQENERAFRAWLSRKREQLHEERRLQRAQELERMSCKRELSSPHETFELWLQRKQEQQEKQRQLDDMRRLEEESTYSVHNRDDCERAFKLWLKKKRLEKRAEQQAARERSRRMVMEARRARRTQDLLCSVGDTRNMRFTDRCSYRF